MLFDTNIIPSPKVMNVEDGFITIKDSTLSIYSSLALKLNPLFSSLSTRVIMGNGKFTSDISIEEDKSIAVNSYKINVNEKIIEIKANSIIGASNAVSTIIQLLILNDEKIIPNVYIEDNPDFEYRGLMLDVCRHFFTKKEIKKFLDLMSFYKYNKFHFHLVDDQAWRLEIKKYPELSKLSGFRKEDDSSLYGGFYTQEDIKELIKYADDYGIEIIPEIEIPGHSRAALAVFPNFTCTGEKLEVPNKWGIFEDVYCAGNEDVFEFLKNIFEEVADLFPSKNIHIGGDECPKKRWKECPKCQKRIKDENLKDEEDLQSYFIARINTHIKQKGKKIMGWDEILEGDKLEDAIVYFWRSFEAEKIIPRLKEKDFKFVLSPTNNSYFDYRHSVKEENEIGIPEDWILAFKNVYDIDAKKIMGNDYKKENLLGFQANIWTEYIIDFNKLCYMTFPRALAISQRAWNYNGKKDYQDFLHSAKKHKKILKKFKIDYAEIAFE